MAPAEGRRQLTLLRIEVTRFFFFFFSMVLPIQVHRLGSDEGGANILVLPIPRFTLISLSFRFLFFFFFFFRSEVRGPLLLDASLYGSVFDDFEEGFGQAITKPSEGAANIFYGNKHTKSLVCDSLAELGEATIDTVKLRVPRRIMRHLEHFYSGGQFAFVALVFKQPTPVSRLHVAVSHPLMRNRLFVPLCVFSPRGIPYGERSDICVDEDPSWQKDLRVSVFSANASVSPSLLLDRLRQEGGPLGSGPVFSRLPAPLQGGYPAVLRLSRHGPSDLWFPLSSCFLALQRASSSASSNNPSHAMSVFSSLVRHKPGCSLALALFASFLSSRGLSSRARRLFRRASSLHPRSAPVFVLLGESLAASSRPLPAASAFRRALALDPFDPRALAGLGLALTATGLSAPPEASLVLTQAALLDPTLEEPPLRLASLALPPSPMGPARAESLLLAQNEERNASRQRLAAYFSMLNHERGALW